MKYLSLAFVFIVLIGTVFFPQENISAEMPNIETETLPRSGNILYVRTEGSSASCSSWEDSCSLQTALALADEGGEIWIAEGTYHPDETDPAIYFSLQSGAALFGGFEGTETAVDQRNWEENLTILRGDLGVQGETSDNSHLIVHGNNLGESTIMDGYTISDGYRTSGFSSGVYLYNSYANLSNLLVVSNIGNQGGGMAITSGENNLNHITFMNNHASWGGGMYTTNSSPTITDVKFMTNTANSGAGMYNETDCSLDLQNVIFS